jgi:hypothetical protein
MESMLNLTSKATSRWVHGWVAAVALHPSLLQILFSLQRRCNRSM